MDDIREESDDKGWTWRKNPTRFLTTKTGFQKFEGKPAKRIIRQQRYLEVIRNQAFGFCTDYEQSHVANKDVAWLCEHDHIVN